MNSKGEFNRCHISRLRVEEEEPEDSKQKSRKKREQANKLLREQDKEWERTRTEELGAGAKLGPTSSPVKRSKPQDGEEEGSQDAPKRKRKKWKHKVWEQGRWGEQIEKEGAGLSTAGEPHLPTGEHYTAVRSRVPEEQHLRQLQISGIWDPAASGEDRPCTGNVAASEAKGSTTTRNSSGGSL